MRIKKSIIALIMTIVVTGNLFAQGESMVRDAFIDAKITGLHYNSTKDAIEFTLKLKAGQGYVRNSSSLGRWDGINLFFDLFIEPGVTLNLAPSAASVTIASGFNIDNAAVQGGPDYTFHPGLGAATAPAGSTPFASVISRENSTRDLLDEYRDVTYYSIPVTSAQKPTSNTRIVLRTYTKPQVPYYYVYNTSAWNALGDDGRYSRFRSEKESYSLDGPCPAQAIWTGNFSSDWFDSDNWANPNVEQDNLPDLGAIPGACTTVFIPGSGYRGSRLDQFNPIRNFPILVAGTNPVCKDIIFFQGGQVGRVDLLTYERAKVQFSFPWDGTHWTNAIAHNFGGGNFYNFAKGRSLDMNFGKWYMLSIPLKGVVSGDLAYGGYPFTFMQKFDVQQTETGRFEDAKNEGGWSTPFTEVDEDFDAGEGLAFYAYSPSTSHLGDYYQPDGSESKTGQPYGIYCTLGILELPSYDHNVSLASRRIQEYNSGTKKSKFHWTDPWDGSFMGDVTERQRSDADYRFVIDGNPDPVYPVKTTASNYTLVGNPYMSALDFDEFAIWNEGAGSTGYNQVYYMWNGYGYDSYALGGVSTGGLTKYIAPMQGFFIKSRRNADGTNTNVEFNAALMSTVTPTGVSNQLRSTSTDVEENIIRISTQHGDKTSRALIAQQANASVEFIDEEDVTKLFSPTNRGFSDVPEVYTLADKNSLAMNFINNVSTTIPIGIRVPESGFTALTLSGMKNYNADKIEFVEILSDGTERATEITNWEGDFVHTFANEESGYQSGRFYLRIAAVTTGMPEANNKAIQVYQERKAIHVVSSPNDKIKQVSVYDLQGRALYSNTSVNADIYQINETFGAEQVLVVKVVTEKNTESVKLIMN